MPAEQHLPVRAAMEEDHGGMPLLGLPIGRQEELPVDLQTVRGVKITCSGSTSALSGKSAGIDPGTSSRAAPPLA